MLMQCCSKRSCTLMVKRGPADACLIGVDIRYTMVKWQQQRSQLTVWIVGLLTQGSAIGVLLLLSVNVWEKCFQKIIHGSHTSCSGGLANQSLHMTASYLTIFSFKSYCSGIAQQSTYWTQSTCLNDMHFELSRPLMVQCT